MVLVLRILPNVQLLLVQKNLQLAVKMVFVSNQEMLAHHSLMINNNARVNHSLLLLVLTVLALNLLIIVNQSSDAHQIKLDVQMDHAVT